MEIEALVEDNEKLKQKIKEISIKYNSISNELDIKNSKIQMLNQEVATLKQWISAMENSTCWKMTKLIRIFADKVKGKHVRDRNRSEPH